MIRVLHVIGAMDRAGAETMIMNLYRSVDRKRVQFDFLVHEERDCDYDEEILNLGGSIARVPRFTGLNIADYQRRVRWALERLPEDLIVHGHIGSSAAIYLNEAKRLGRVAIAHSHRQHYPLSAQELAFRAVSFPTRYVANEFLACSVQAGIDRFGKAVTEGDHFHVLNNGIPVHSYENSDELHRAARRKLGIGDAPLIGHVGRFDKVKNHDFLIEAFEHVRNLRPDARLLLVGQGEREERIRSLVEERGLTNSVVFYGLASNVSAVVRAMDVFIMPSFTEGLGMALVEAQAAGVPCVFSDGVPESTLLTPSSVRLPLSVGPQVWADKVLERLDTPRQWGADADLVRDAGFDIVETAQWLVRYYENLSRGVRWGAAIGASSRSRLSRYSDIKA